MVFKEAILRDLRDAIAKGEIRPGDRLKENAISSRFGVSRTPVREILKQLEKEGLVRISPNHGAKVVALTTKDVADIYEMLITLEGAAARLACSEIGDQEIGKLKEYQFMTEKAISKRNIELVLELNVKFHALLTECSRNPYLAETRRNYRNILNPFGRFVAFIPQFLEATLEEHPKIIEAIISRNAPLAEFLAREHMEKAKVRMLEYIRCLQKKGDREKKRKDGRAIAERKVPFPGNLREVPRKTRSKGVDIGL